MATVIPNLIALIFGVLPLIAAIWAILTLNKMRRSLDDIRDTVSKIEQRLERSGSAIG